MRRRLDPWLWGAVLGGATTVVAVLFLPWHRSGGVVRNGASLVRSAAAVGIVDTLPRQFLRVGVALLPTAAVGLLVAAGAGRGCVAGALAIMIGGTALSCALLLYRIDNGRQPGPQATLVVATVTLGSGLVLVGRRGERR